MQNGRYVKNKPINTYKIKNMYIFMQKTLDNMYMRWYSKTMQERYKGFQDTLHRISNAIIKVIGT